MVVGFITTNVPMQSVPITTDVLSSNLYLTIRARSTTLCDRVCQWLATCRWFSPGSPVRAAKRIFEPQGKRKLGPPPPILHIMIFKLSPPRCVISKESVQQKWIDELWFRKQLSACLFVWTFNYKSWAPGRHPGLSPPPLLSGPASGFHTKIIVRHDIAEILLKVALNTIKQTD